MSLVFTDLVFSSAAWLEYVAWQGQDKRTLKKINDLIKDIKRNGALHGTGKPEQLKYYEIPTFSRRIDEANRLVYRCDEENKKLKIFSCAGHYADVNVDAEPEY